MPRVTSTYAPAPLWTTSLPHGWPYRSSAASRPAQPAMAVPLDRHEMGGAVFDGLVPAVRPAAVPAKTIGARFIGLCEKSSPFALALGATCAAALVCAPVALIAAKILQAAPAALLTARLGSVAAGLLRAGAAIALGLPVAMAFGRFLITYADEGIPFNALQQTLGIEQSQRFWVGFNALVGGASLGAAFAPILVSTALPGAAMVAAAAGCMLAVGLGLNVAAGAAAFTGRPAVATFASIAVHGGLATLTGTFLMGASAAPAIASAITLSASGCIASALLVFRAGDVLRAPTAWADAHVERPENPWSLDGASCEQPGHVVGTPHEVAQRLSELRQAARLDHRGEMFWPGQPVVSWSNCDGVGQTVHAHAFAAALGGDLIRLTGAQLRCMEAPGFSNFGIDYLLCIWLQAEERACRLGKPQILLVENIHHLLPAPADVPAAELSLLYGKYVRILDKLSRNNSARHRTVLLLTSSSDDGSHEVVQKIISPRKAITFAPLTATMRRRLVEAAATNLLSRLQAMGSDVSPGLFDSPGWQQQFDALSVLPIGGRLINDVFESLRAATIGNATGDALGQVLLDRCTARTERLREDCAAAQSAVAHSGVQNIHGRQSRKNDDLIATLLDFVQDPNRVVATISKQIENKAVGAVSTQNTLRQKLLDDVSERFQSRFSSRMVMGAGGYEASDYIAAWSKDFDEASRFAGTDYPDMAGSPYVRDTLLPMQSISSALRVSNWVYRGR